MQTGRVRQRAVRNKSRRNQVRESDRGTLVSRVREQGHESGTLDCLGNGMLAGSLTTRFAAANNPTVTVGQLAQQVEILVVDVHRTRAYAIDTNGVLLGNFNVRFSFGHNQSWRF